MRTWTSAIGLGLLFLGGLGCGEAKVLMGLYPTAVTTTESVDQRHYVGSTLQELQEAALLVLHAHGFRVLGDKKHHDGIVTERIIDAERNGGETVRLILSPLGGEEVRVSVQVNPVESTLGAEIQTDLASHLLRPTPAGTGP